MDDSEVVLGRKTPANMSGTSSWMTFQICQELQKNQFRIYFMEETIGGQRRN